MPAYRPVPAGTRFGRLVVLRDRRPGEHSIEVRCDCGTETEVPLGNARRGHTISCGCAWREAITIHGWSGFGSSRTYVAWQNMISRCYRESCPGYERYRDRGIVVCDRWRLSFTAFLEDMGEAPPGLLLDRIDNEGNYEPGNCRWTDHFTQMQNSRPAIEKRARLARQRTEVSS